MNEREYVRLRKTLVDEFRKNLDALDRVWALSSDLPPPVCEGESVTVSPTIRQRPHGEASAMVSAMINSLPEEFSTRDVEAAIRNTTDQPPERSSISHALKRMEKEGRLAIVIKGKGKRSTVYRKCEQPQNGMCAEWQRARVIELAKELGLSPPEFRQKFMDPKKRPRLQEMTFDDVNEMISEAEAELPSILT